MVKIGIIGFGVVGKSLYKWLNKNTSHAICIYDPPLGLTDKLTHCDYCFFCAPVPTIENDNIQDLSILKESLKLTKTECKFFIRSTVLPGTADRFDCYSMPEFLTERTAYDDMCRMDIITGYDGPLQHILPGKKIIRVSNSEAELAKYAHNTFGAMKVTFFNFIYKICQRKGLDYERVKEAILMSGYINEPHTMVPGPDGKLGYGGKCFPKDVKAFSDYVSYIEDNELISMIDEYNSIFRNDA